MFGVAWFLVWISASGAPMQFGPFMFEHTCQAAIENAREERGSEMGGQSDWHLPRDARCEMRAPGTEARWPAPFGVEGGRW